MKARAVAAISLLALWSCGGTSPAGPTPPIDSLQALRITVPSNISAGQAVQLTATAILSGGGSKVVPASTISWQSSDSAVITISSSGLLYALQSGAVDVRGTYEGRTSDLVRITVNPRPGDRIIAGQTIEDALTMHGTSRVFQFTAPSDGTLVVQVSYSGALGFLELELEGKQYFGRPTIVGNLRVTAGTEYGIEVADGSPWDYDDMNVRFTLTASMQ
jgi:hypothetical protein